MGKVVGTRLGVNEGMTLGPAVVLWLGSSEGLTLGIRVGPAVGD